MRLQSLWRLAHTLTSLFENDVGAANDTVIPSSSSISPRNQLPIELPSALEVYRRVCMCLFLNSLGLSQDSSDSFLQQQGCTVIRSVSWMNCHPDQSSFFGKRNGEILPNRQV